MRAIFYVLYANTEIGKSKNRREVNIILQQDNPRFNHRIDESAQAKTTITENKQGENASAEIPMFQKTLGGTTYTVSVHFSQHSGEKLEDKILRILESEAMEIV